MASNTGLHFPSGQTPWDRVLRACGKASRDPYHFQFQSNFFLDANLMAAFATPVRDRRALMTAAQASGTTTDDQIDSDYASVKYEDEEDEEDFRTCVRPQSTSEVASRGEPYGLDLQRPPDGKLVSYEWLWRLAGYILTDRRASVLIRRSHLFLRIDIKLHADSVKPRQCLQRLPGFPVSESKIRSRRSFQMAGLNSSCHAFARQNGLTMSSISCRHKLFLMSLSSVTFQRQHIHMEEPLAACSEDSLARNALLKSILSVGLQPHVSATSLFPGRLLRTAQSVLELFLVKHLTGCNSNASAGFRGMRNNKECDWGLGGNFRWHTRLASPCLFSRCPGYNVSKTAADDAELAAFVRDSTTGAARTALDGVADWLEMRKKLHDAFAPPSASDLDWQDEHGQDFSIDNLILMPSNLKILDSFSSTDHQFSTPLGIDIKDSCLADMCTTLRLQAPF
ncbi:hypothetical protein IWZ01DRAFT_558710 [Phyllosticta capitalensis]